MIKGFKGFAKGLICRGYQYKIGGEYKTDKAEACQSGFHFCEYPLDIFAYYSPAESEFAEVTGSGEIDRSDSSKIACTSIFISAKTSLPMLVSASVKYTLDRINRENKKESSTGYRSAATNTGNRSAATNTGYGSVATNTGYGSVATNTGYGSVAMNTGYRSAATNTGYGSVATNTGYGSVAMNTGYRSAATNTDNRSVATNTGGESAATNTGGESAATNTGGESAATNTGNRSVAMNTGFRSAATNTGNRSVATNTGYGSVAEVSGRESIACGLGEMCKAKGALGCWLVLMERDGTGNIKEVKTVKVDGKKIKPDNFYILQEGKFIISE